MRDSSGTERTVIDTDGNVTIASGITVSNGDAIKDENGNEQIKFATTSSAVNEVTVTNAATGNAPSISATGETNVGITVAGKGTGSVNLGQATSTGIKLVADQPILDSASNELIKFTKATTAVNEITIANAATGNGVSVSATGGDTDIDINVAGKGTGAVNIGQATSTGVKLVADQPILDSSGNEFIKFTKTTNAVNEIMITNKATGGSPVIQSTGGDAAVGLILQSKGASEIALIATNAVQFQSNMIQLSTNQPITDNTGNELIKFVKTTSAVNEVTVTNAATGNNPSITATGGDTDVGLTLSAKGAGVVTINDADILKEGTVTSHNYAAGTTAWTLSATEKLSTQLIATNAGGAVDVIAPSENRIYWIYNNSGQNLTIKKTAGTGVTIATGKYAGVYYNGSDYAKLTPDL